MAPRSRSRLGLGLAAFQLLNLFATPVSGQQPDPNSPWIGQTQSGFGPDVSLADGWDASYPDYEGAVPLPTSDTASNGSDYLDSSLRRRGVGDFFLRIMPLGASITQGINSHDKNGYRSWLRQELRFQGWDVNMVGTQQTGTMKDWDHEGHPGWVITETVVNGHLINGVQQAWENARSLKPNLVLINVGTNDCSDGIDLGNAGLRMEKLVTEIFDSVPGVVIVMSTLVPSPAILDCARDLSNQYLGVAARLQNGRLAIADFYNSMDTVTMFTDDPARIHPNDFGYKFMASVWIDAISKVQGAISAPLPNGADDAAGASTTCPKIAGVSRGPVTTQLGSGYDDGIYVHKSQGHGVLPTLRFTKPTDPSEAAEVPSLIWFAPVTSLHAADRDLAYDDWIRIFRRTATDGKNEYWVRENLGNGVFAASVAMDVGINCDNGEAFAWADFNNDGLADFYCITNTTITVSLNQGTRPPTFKSIGVVVPDISPFAPNDVRIADIDGDGRADLCFINDNGDIGCSRNGGFYDDHVWHGFHTSDGLRDIIFTGKNKGNKYRVRLADLNGDFRADWMWIGDDGDVDTYINQRGTGAGLQPSWPAAGITHAGLGVNGTGDNIIFGRVYGSNRLDYLHLKEGDGVWDMEVWENLGAGGTKLKADGVFYCDMTGSGSDDYVWIYMDGHADPGDLFVNIHSPPDWGHSIKISLQVPGPRVGIHLADWDNDGYCDVLVQDKESGALNMWKNTYTPGSTTLSFVNIGVQSGPAKCGEGWGVGIFDRGLQLADIDGDGRPDYLCLERNGRITSWLNTASGMMDVGQVKATENFYRSDIRFGDVENRGRADMVHFDRYTGAGTVFQNDGYQPNNTAGNLGSTFHWTNRGVLYSPIDRAENMHLVNFGGLGRADLHHTWPNKNDAETFFNECGGGGGGDDGPVGDPGLPAYP